MIHPLSQVCSIESRWKVLSPCLIQLLQDQSRWVKTAALRVLGYFISTFHNQQTFTNDSDVSNQFDDFLFWRQPILIDFDDEQDQQLLINSNHLSNSENNNLNVN